MAIQLPPQPPDFVVKNDQGVTSFAYVKYPEETFESVSPNNYGMFMIYYPSLGCIFVYNKYGNRERYDIQQLTDNQYIAAINYMLTKYLDFDIGNGSNDRPLFIVFDKPQGTGSREPAYHRDNIINFVSLSLANIPNINAMIRVTEPSDYTCIQYFPGDVCVSTSINLNNTANIFGRPTIGDSANMVRFLACNGTTLCINNIQYTHSVPHEVVGAERNLGNTVLTAQTAVRNICRLQFKYLNNFTFDLRTDDRFIPFLLNHPGTAHLGIVPISDTKNAINLVGNFSRPNLNRLTVTEYLAHPARFAGIEVGGGKNKNYVMFENKKYKVHIDKKDSNKKYISSKPLGKILLSNIRGKYRYI